MVLRFWVAYFKFLLYIFVFSLDPCFALDTGYSELVVCQGFLTPLFLLWLLVYNKKPNIFILDFGEEQSPETVLLDSIVPGTEADRWENVEESYTECQSFTHLQWEYRPSWCKHMVWKFLLYAWPRWNLLWAIWDKPVLPSGTCMLRGLSPFGFPDDVSLSSYRGEERSETIGARNSSGGWRRKWFFSQTEHNKANVMLFLLDSWFHFSVQILLKTF